jgi:uncharacterized protein YggU (UPF0235/DUF167 family)
VVITVRVHPRASRAKSSWKQGLLELWITASPVAGAANKAALNAVARHFDVPVSTVSLKSGARSRTKLVELHQLLEGSRTGSSRFVHAAGSFDSQPQ